MSNIVDVAQAEIRLLRKITFSVADDMVNEILNQRATVAELEQKLAERDKEIILLKNCITRAIGWVEDVKCIGEQAIQEQRSFVNELRIAALNSAQGKSDE